MSGCCSPGGHEDLFGARFSRHVTRRYRKRGLDPTAQKMVDFLVDEGIEGASVLEIGGGVGEIQLELLRRGASRTTNLELVDAYDADAAALAAEAGVADRITRRRVDLAVEPEAVERHDIVVLHRVVCCYPDYERLLAAAAAHANRMLVFSHPPRHALSRAFIAAENLVFRIRGSNFRTFAHDPEALAAAAAQHGLVVQRRRSGRVWQMVGLTAA